MASMVGPRWHSQAICTLTTGFSIYRIDVYVCSLFFLILWPGSDNDTRIRLGCSRFQCIPGTPLIAYSTNTDGGLFHLARLDYKCCVYGLCNLVDCKQYQYIRVYVHTYKVYTYLICGASLYYCARGELCDRHLLKTKLSIKPNPTVPCLSPSVCECAVHSEQS